LTKNEINTFTKWRIDYGFRYEIIYYAYELTVERTNNYSLSYMDSIITKWYEQKLTNLNEIRAYEKGYKEDKKRKKEKDQNSAYTSTFDTNDFFLDAVRRSFGDDFDPSILNT
jgi:DnaD/phage-associated family protein